MAIAVHIRKERAGRELVAAGYASRSCDIFKLPVAEVAIQPVSPLEAAEVNVAPAIAINISRSDSGTVVNDGVSQAKCVVKVVRKEYSGLAAHHSFEARFAG